MLIHGEQHFSNTSIFVEKETNNVISGSDSLPPKEGLGIIQNKMQKNKLNSRASDLCCGIWGIFCSLFFIYLA